jgi:hypothetical protein
VKAQESMVGLWDAWNSDGEPTPYGLSGSYDLAADWLAPCATVADWGCGRTYFRRYLRQGQWYVGIDGSGTFADVLCDLREVELRTEGILLRHVLEHNFAWREILERALACYEKRLCIALFTPLAESQHFCFADGGIDGVPDIFLPRRDLLELLRGHIRGHEVLVGGGAYHQETILYCSRETA